MATASNQPCIFGDQPADTVVAVRQPNDARQKLAFLFRARCELGRKLPWAAHANFYGGDGDDGDGDNGEDD